jgi:hypothetical protein
MAIHTDNVDSDPWTEFELHVLKSLVALNFPMDIICKELDRSWTASALKAIDLVFNNRLSQRARHMARLKRVQEIRN